MSLDRSWVVSYSTSIDNIVVSLTILEIFDVKRTFPYRAVTRNAWQTELSGRPQAQVYLRIKWHLDPSTPLATTDMDRKVGGVVPLLGGAGHQSNAMWPTFVPSGILNHPAVWPQKTWAENFGDVPLSEELGPHLTQCRLAEAYLRIKWHLGPSSRLATTDMGPKFRGCAP